MVLALLALPKSSRMLIVLVGALALSAILAALVVATGMRTAAEQNAGQEARRLAVVIAGHTSRALHAIDLVLSDIAAEADFAALQTAADVRAAVSTPQMQHSLHGRLAGLPQAGELVVLDADGTMLVTSRTWPSPAVSAADLPFFRAARDDTWTAPFLSEPVSNQFSGTRGVIVVHRISAHGTNGFLGVLMASFDLDDMIGFHSAIGLPPGMGVALVRQDGVVLTQSPQAVVRARGAVVGGLNVGNDGLTYSERLAGFQAAIEVSVTAEAIYADWDLDVTLLAGGTICAVLCMLLLFRALVRQFHRLESARLAVQEKSLALETTLANMDQGLMMVTADHEVAVCNERAITLLGLPPDLMRGRPSFDAVLDWQWRQGEFGGHEAPMRVMRQRGGILERPHTYERRRPNGVCLEVRSVPLAGGGVVRTFTDVTLRRLADEQVSYAAHHDALTGLSNRARFAERLEEAVLAAGKTGRAPAVLYLDLDRFKLVNDTLGHHAGDELLRQVAARMRGAVRDSDTLARMGGDEFALVLAETTGIDAAMALSKRLLRVLRQPFNLGDGTAQIGVSIGIAGAGAPGATPDELLRNADLALYRAKATGRDTVCVFDATLDTRTQGEFHLEGAMQHALQEGQFALAYQPIWDIRTNCIVGAEALLRWHHPTHGMISPADFIPLAERTGLIVPLGRWVMEAACREALTWACPVSVSVNVAPSQLRRRELLGEVRSMLAETGLPPERLKLEITESQLLDETDEVVGMLTGLRDMGLRLALDDFGTGHSSISALKAVAFSDLKIDRGFTQGIVGDARSRGLLEAILQVCRVMELDCVAEGVETEEQLAMLRGLGCTHAQGYLLGRPEPAGAIRRTLWSAASQQHLPQSDPGGVSGPPTARERFA